MNQQQQDNIDKRSKILKLILNNQYIRGLIIHYIQDIHKNLCKVNHKPHKVINWHELFNDEWNLLKFKYYKQYEQFMANKEANKDVDSMYIVSHIYDTLRVYPKNYNMDSCYARQILYSYLINTQEFEPYFSWSLVLDFAISVPPPCSTTTTPTIDERDDIILFNDIAEVYNKFYRKSHGSPFPHPRLCGSLVDDIEKMDYMISKGYTTPNEKTMFVAIQQGNIDAVKHLHIKYKLEPIEALDDALSWNRLEIAKYIHSTFPYRDESIGDRDGSGDGEGRDDGSGGVGEGKSNDYKKPETFSTRNYNTYTMALHGYLDCIKFLNETYPNHKSCWKNDLTYRAIDGRHLDVVKYLHFNRTDCQSDSDFSDACYKDKSGEIIDFLVQHRPQLLADDKKSLLGALYIGRMDLVERIWNLNRLCDRQKIPYSQDNYLHNAAYGGNLECLKFIHFNHPFSSSLNAVKAIDSIAKDSSDPVYSEMLKFFKIYRSREYKSSSYYKNQLKKRRTSTPDLI